MCFINSKVCLITGGASGIGLSTAKEFLKNGIKGITIADLYGNSERIVQELENEFGANRVVFVRTDVSRREEIEGTTKFVKLNKMTQRLISEAFKKTVELFGNVDILVNSAGTCMDNNLEKEIAVNLTGTMYANFLAFDKYLPAHKTGDEGVIVNISSSCGLEGMESIPVYSATKHGVIGLSKSLGTKSHYEHTRVRVLAICPGVTQTPIFNNLESAFVGPRYKELYSFAYASFVFQKPEVAGKAILRIIEEGTNGSIWAIIEGKLHEVKLPSLADLLKK